MTQILKFVSVMIIFLSVFSKLVYSSKPTTTPYWPCNTRADCLYKECDYPAKPFCVSSKCLCV
uniref:Nodule-specific cysteine-rich peptide L16 n=1 Tax=Lens culinaris TaxID=3864 RepID=A0A7T8IG69_LENCU|nr:nodule-specific cysteine-rich peptide L16 [Lens culinaris]